ncbi:MAG: ROK family protein [Acidobacteria bacterium]|nr:MAG: ROK family protein [Acidobacteriota bacterium]
MSEVTVGIDVGGTNTAVGLVDRDGGCLVQAAIPTLPERDARSLVARLSGKIGELHRPFSERSVIVGIGIGAPDANYYRGTVEHPPNLNWPGVTPIVALFRERFDVPVVVTNDANAAALGEMLFGAARGMRDFIVITLGTGLGSGLVANGELIYGADGFAGELGHTVVDPHGRQCACGQGGCLETYASATGICRTVFELLCDSKDESELRDVTFNELTAKRVSEAALRGDALALAAFEFTGRILGMKLADAVVHTSPEAIILVGGLANAADLIFAPTKRWMEEFLFPIFKGKVKLLPSGMPAGADPAVLGAAALIWAELAKARVGGGATRRSTE